MISLERIRVASIVENIVENGLRWFEYVERILLYIVVWRIYQTKESRIRKGGGRSRKIISETIIKGLKANELDSICFKCEVTFNLEKNWVKWYFDHVVELTWLNEITLCRCNSEKKVIYSFF